MKKILALVCTLCLLLTAVSRTTLPALTLPLLIPTGVFAALLGAAAVGWHREGVWQQQGQLLLCRQHRFHLHQLCVFHPDTGFTALQSPWAVTVQRANLTLVFPGKEKVTVRSVPLSCLRPLLPHTVMQHGKRYVCRLSVLLGTGERFALDDAAFLW